LAPPEESQDTECQFMYPFQRGVEPGGNIMFEYGLVDSEFAAWLQEEYVPIAGGWQY
jgi:hypothetical protein